MGGKALCVEAGWTRRPPESRDVTSWDTLEGPWFFSCALVVSAGGSLALKSVTFPCAVCVSVFFFHEEKGCDLRVLWHGVLLRSPWRTCCVDNAMAPYAALGRVKPANTVSEEGWNLGGSPGQDTSFDTWWEAICVFGTVVMPVSHTHTALECRQFCVVVVPGVWQGDLSCETSVF